MRTKKTDSLPYDGAKLKNQIESHNYTMHGLSYEMGYSRTYLGNVCHHNKGVKEIPRRAVMLLESFGIHYDDYKPDPEPIPEVVLPLCDGECYTPEEKVVTVKLDEEQMDYILGKLQQIVSAAIYSEVKKAWNE